MQNLFTPLFIVTLALLWGVWGLRPEPGVIEGLMLMTVAAASAFFFLRKRRCAYIAIVLSLGLLVSWRFASQRLSYETTAAVSLPEDEYITAEGRLMDFPEIRDDGQVLSLAASCLEFHGQRMNVALNIRLKVMGRLPALNRGDRVKAEAIVTRWRPAGNFFPDSLGDYYLSRGVHFNGYCKSGLLVKKTLEGPAFWRGLGAWRQALRGAIEERYGAGENGDSDHPRTLDRKGVFLEAILLGDQGRLQEDDKEHLIETGVLHLLAISGAHIGIIAFFSLWLLRRFRLPPRSRYLATALVIILFLAISGFKVSAERAVWMALLIFIARILYYEVNMFNVISAAAFFLLIRNPAQFLDAGYMLTVVLTAAIVAGRKLFLPLFPAKSRMPIWLRETLSANLAPFLVAWPLSLFYFKRFALTGLWMGLILAPVMALVTGMSLLLIPAAPLWAGGARAVLAALDWPLTVFFFLVGGVGERAGFLNLYAAAPPLAVTAAITGLFFLAAALPPGSKGRKAAMALMLAGLTLISVPLFPYRPANLEVFFLDVGQGDAQVVVFPGGDALLLDGGGSHFSRFQVGRNVVLPFLLQKRIRVRWAAVSHFHPDHCRGVAELLPILAPEAVWVGGRYSGDPYYREFMAYAGKIPVVYVAQGRFWDIAGCRVRVLHPPAFVEGIKPVNDDSLTLHISDGQNTFLFPGDIEAPVESALTAHYGEELRAAVLKTPHHGSNTSSSLAFLKAARPQWAVISYRRPNRYHFPHKEVLQRFRELKTNVLGTGKRGAVHFISLPEGMRVETDH